MKTMRDLQGRKAQIGAEMETLLDAAEQREDRSFSKEEQAKFDGLQNELAMIDREMLAVKAKSERVSTEKRSTLMEALRESVQAGRRIEMKVRENTTTTSLDAATTPLLIEDIQPALEEGLILDKVGIRLAMGLYGQWQWPLPAAIEASIAGEEVEIEDSQITLTKLTPKTTRISISVPITIEAINADNGKVYDYAQSQLVTGIVRTLNRAMFCTEKINDEFYGPFAGLTAGSLSATPTMAELLAMKGTVLASGVEYGDTGCYVMSESTKALLEATPTEAGGGRMIIENGRLAGYPVFCTNYINQTADGSAASSEYIGFGIWSYQPLGQFGEMTLIVDPFTAATKGVVRLTMQSLWATTTLRSEAFAISAIGA